MKRSLLICLILLLSACSSLRGERERYWLKSDINPGMDDAVALLHYASYARGLSASERDSELERQRSGYQRDKGDFRRVQYALLLSVPQATAAERRLALQVLEPVDKRGHDADLAALAGLVEAQLLGYRRADELEKKLDAVKDIERSLLQRGKSKP